MRRLPGWLDWRPWGFVSAVEGILVGRHRVHFKLLPDCQCTSEPGAPWRVSTSLVCVCILVTAAVRGLVTINPNWSQEGTASITVKAAQLRSATLFDTLHAPPLPGTAPPGTTNKTWASWLQRNRQRRFEVSNPVGLQFFWSRRE